jgi:hypothetical protein
LVNSEDFPEKITLMSSSYSVSYYTSSTAKPEEPFTTREVPAVALGIIEKGLTWEDLLQIRLIS